MPKPLLDVTTLVFRAYEDEMEGWFVQRKQRSPRSKRQYDYNLVQIEKGEAYFPGCEVSLDLSFPVESDGVFAGPIL